MAALVIDRAALPEAVSSCFAARRIAVVRQQNGSVTLSPVIDPADYDDDTDYLCAVPGVKEKLVASYNAPASEFSPMPDDWINRNV